jgi:hypothetical protein
VCRSRTRSVSAYSLSNINTATRSEIYARQIFQRIGRGHGVNVLRDFVRRSLISGLRESARARECRGAAPSAVNIVVAKNCRRTAARLE